MYVMSGGSIHGNRTCKAYTCMLCLEGQDMVNVHCTIYVYDTSGGSRHGKFKSIIYMLCIMEGQYMVSVHCTITCVLYLEGQDMVNVQKHNIHVMSGGLRHGKRTFRE